MVEIITGKGGLPFAQIHTRSGKASVCLLGATVTDFQPTGHEPVLYVSPNSLWQDGVSIRGGIPVCWPWFGPSAIPGQPIHGFVRNSCWRVERAAASTSAITLDTADNDFTQAAWPHRFGLRLKVRVGSELVLTLLTTNRDAHPFEFSAALHTYFRISDISAIRILGLEGTPYLDKVRDYARTVTPGPITIDQRVDRVYLDTEAACVIEDPGMKRKIVIEKAGSRTTVVWNPWEQLSAEMSDLGAGQYRHFVCVETVVGPQEHKVLQPGETHEMVAKMRVEAL